MRSRKSRSGWPTPFVGEGMKIKSLFLREFRQGVMEEGQAHHTMKCQAPSLDRLKPCGERLDSKGERLAQDEGQLHKERLGCQMFRPVDRDVFVRDLNRQLGTPFH